MSQRSKWALFTIIFFSIQVVPTNEAQTRLDLHVSSPSEKWTITYQPFRGPGHESIPVEVVSVGGTVRDGWVGGCETLRNLSSKDIRRVAYGLYVFDVQNQDVPVLKRKGGSLSWREGLAAGSRKSQTAHKFTIGYIFRPLLKEKPLAANYRIEILIRKVWYVDGTVWEYPDMFESN